MKRNSNSTTVNNRRSFLRGALATGTAVAGSAVLGGKKAFAQASGPLTPGDVAILKLLAAAEIIEADLWEQYTELGGVTQGTQNNYQLAFQFLDSDGSQYITSNTLDELSHANFLNAYLVFKGEKPVNLDAFRTLPSSQANGANKTAKRLTNLTNLTVDTSWYIRDRSNTNPDFGAAFMQALEIKNRKAIPTNNSDFNDPDHIQVIANTAAFHFGFIEQGGSSLYATLSQKVSSLEVLKITLSIGGDEIRHFGEWMDFAGNAVQGPPFSFANSQNPVSDDGLTFPDFNELQPEELFQTNLIFPVPCEFISNDLPLCAVIRPTGPGQIDAKGAITSFIDDGLFIGQPESFTNMLLEMAAEADAAVREC